MASLDDERADFGRGQSVLVLDSQFCKLKIVNLLGCRDCSRIPQEAAEETFNKCGNAHGRCRQSSNFSANKRKSSLFIDIGLTYSYVSKIVSVK